MAPWPADTMWAYVSGAVLSVCGVSAGRSGRTFVPRTRNLKVQMSPPALCGRWYSVASRREINKWPLVYFWFMFRVLAPKCCTCCLSCSTAELSFWDIKQLRVRCWAAFLFLLFSPFDFDAAAIYFKRSSFLVISVLFSDIRSHKYIQVCQIWFAIIGSDRSNLVFVL